MSGAVRFCCTAGLRGWIAAEAVAMHMLQTRSMRYMTVEADGYMFLKSLCIEDTEGTKGVAGPF